MNIELAIGEQELVCLRQIELPITLWRETSNKGILSILIAVANRFHTQHP
jgi:hypothetical protein